MSPIRLFIGLALVTTLAVAGCADKAATVGPDANKLAADLVQCRNDQSDLKDQLAALRLENAKLKAAADQTVHTDPIDLHAGAAPAEKHHDGNLPPEEITKVIRANAGSLRVCYEKGLKRNPNLQTISSVKAHFFIRRNGHGERVGIGPHVEAEMESCMAAAIAKWRFPEFEGDPIEVETPVNLMAK